MDAHPTAHEHEPAHPTPGTYAKIGVFLFVLTAAVPVARLDRISVYLPPEVGIRLLDEIKARGAGEVWFNPGSESPELLSKAETLGLNVIQACSIVDVGVSPGQL